MALKSEEAGLQLASAVPAGWVADTKIKFSPTNGFACMILKSEEGGLQLASAVPAGWVADTWRRDYVLRGAAGIGAAAGALLAATLVLRWPIWMLFVAMSLLGELLIQQIQLLEMI